MKTSKRVAFVGAFSALAIVMSVLEQYVPVQLLIPLPGIKLGIANVITLFALVRMDFKTAFAILLVRCSVVGLLFGNPVSFAMSMTGGILAICVMWLLLRSERFFSLYGVSIAGAAAHNIGQILCSAFVMQSVYTVAYLPVLLISAVVTGLLIAVLVQGISHLLK